MEVESGRVMSEAECVEVEIGRVMSEAGAWRWKAGA